MHFQTGTPSTSKRFLQKFGETASNSTSLTVENRANTLNIPRKRVTYLFFDAKFGQDAELG